MESRMREIRTYGLTRGKSHRRQRRGVGLYSTIVNHAANSESKRTSPPRGGEERKSPSHQSKPIITSTKRTNYVRLLLEVTQEIYCKYLKIRIRI